MDDRRKTEWLAMAKSGYYQQYRTDNNVVCDRCMRANIKAAVSNRLANNHLCLQCVDSLLTGIDTEVFVQPKKNNNNNVFLPRTRMEQDMFRTVTFMEQKMLRRGLKNDSTVTEKWDSVFYQK